MKTMFGRAAAGWAARNPPIGAARTTIPDSNPTGPFTSELRGRRRGTLRISTPQPVYPKTRRRRRGGSADGRARVGESLDERADVGHGSNRGPAGRSRQPAGGEEVRARRGGRNG